MDFYLTAPDGSRIHFPVNPERITCDTGNRILTFDIISLGEISLPRGRIPTRFSFEGFFPGEARRNDPMVKSWRSPKELAGILSETFIMGLAGLLKAGWLNLVTSSRMDRMGLLAMGRTAWTTCSRFARAATAGRRHGIPDGLGGEMPPGGRGAKSSQVWRCEAYRQPRSLGREIR